jgi:hypothetical protein
MSDTRASEVVLLCEDKQHEVFVYRYLSRLGYGRHAIRITKSPAGRGAGDAFVLNAFVRELVACRTRNRRAKTSLVVIQDADLIETAKRIQAFTDRLVAEQVPALADDEPIVLLIAKRNIETWIHALDGEDVDEIKKYSRLDGHERDCDAAVAKLFEARKSNQDADNAWPPSLQRGYSELARLHSV